LFCYSPQLIFDIAKATGVEVRAKHNDYVKKKNMGTIRGSAVSAQSSTS